MPAGIRKWSCFAAGQTFTYCHGREVRSSLLRGTQICRHRDRVHALTQAKVDLPVRGSVENVVAFVLGVSMPN